MSKILVLIPARGGSKGIPGKNIKPLNGKPLIYYSLDIAVQFFDKADICVSTDDANIISKVEEYGISVPFVRPAELSSDTAGSNEVILHALDFFEERGITYDYTLLLQPTSPFRRAEDVRNALAMASETSFEMIISVAETDSNPYYVLFEDDENGILQKSKEAFFTRRQDCPKVWQANGAIYIINNQVLRNKGNLGLLQKKKFVMQPEHSLDLDTPLDWKIAEFLMKNN
jgi:N-acylneuraminate cytidylyltransferase